MKRLLLLTLSCTAFMGLFAQHETHTDTVFSVSKNLKHNRHVVSGNKDKESRRIDNPVLPAFPILRTGEQNNGRRVDNPDLPAFPILRTGAQNDGRKVENPDIPAIPILRTGAQNDGRKVENPDIPAIPILRTGEGNDGRKVENPDIPAIPILRTGEGNDGRKVENPDLPAFPILRTGDENDGRKVENPDLPAFPILRAGEENDGRKVENPDLPAFPILRSSNDAEAYRSNLPACYILKALDHADEMKYDSLVIYSNDGSNSIIEKALPIYENGLLTSIKYYQYSNEFTNIYRTYFNDKGLVEKTDYYVIDHKNGDEVMVNSIKEDNNIIGGLIVKAANPDAVMYVTVDDFYPTMFKCLEVTDNTSDTYIKCFYSAVESNEPEIEIEESSIELRGNLVETSLQVVSTFDNVCKYQIVSMSGSIIRQGVLNYGENDIDLSNIVSGNYIIAVSSPKGLISNRIIKQ